MPQTPWEIEREVNIGLRQRIAQLEAALVEERARQVWLDDVFISKESAVFIARRQLAEAGLLLPTAVEREGE